MDDEEDGAMDPRINEELETLNQTSEEINNLENKMEVTRNTFKMLQTDCTHRLQVAQDRIGPAINKARIFYDTERKFQAAQLETMNAVRRYQKAIGQHEAAKEMVYVAEQALKNRDCSEAWQEMLNNATTKVNDAEFEKLESEIGHRKTASTFNQYGHQMAKLKKKLRSAIQKSGPYFEQQATYNKIMEEQKVELVKLADRLCVLKAQYSRSLQVLESISEDIHNQRQERKLIVAAGRTEAVGCDADESETGVVVDDKPVVDPRDEVQPEVVESLAVQVRTAGAGCADDETSRETFDTGDVLPSNNDLNIELLTVDGDSSLPVDRPSKSKQPVHINDGSKIDDDHQLSISDNSFPVLQRPTSVVELDDFQDFQSCTSPRVSWPSIKPPKRSVYEPCFRSELSPKLVYGKLNYKDLMNLQKMKDLTKSHSPDTSPSTDSELFPLPWKQRKNKIAGRLAINLNQLRNYDRGTSNPDSPCAEVSNSDSPCPDVSNSESPCTEVSNSESPCTEVSNSESPCTEVSNSDSPCTEVSNTDSPFTDPNEVYRRLRIPNPTPTVCLVDQSEPVHTDRDVVAPESNDNVHGRIGDCIADDSVDNAVFKVRSSWSHRLPHGRELGLARDSRGADGRVCRSLDATSSRIKRPEVSVSETMSKLKDLAAAHNQADVSAGVVTSDKLATVETMDKLANIENVGELADIENVDKWNDIEAIDELSDVESTAKFANIKSIDKLADIGNIDNLADSEVPGEFTDMETINKTPDSRQSPDDAESSA